MNIRGLSYNNYTIDLFLYDCSGIIVLNRKQHYLLILNKVVTVTELLK